MSSPFIVLFMIIAFLAGLYFCGNYTSKEAFSNNTIEHPRCPNLLIQKGSTFYLFNSKIDKVPGVNPVVFKNLEEYVEFLEWQRGQGIRCPVLYLQHTYDAQGKSVYKSRPSVTNPQGGLPPSYVNPSLESLFDEQKQQLNAATNPDAYPLLISQNEPVTPYLHPNPTLLVDATQDDRPYNINSFPAYDNSSYYVGTTTPLDIMNEIQQNLPASPDPMDPNWGGAGFTQSLIDKGYYKGNTVKIQIH